MRLSNGIEVVVSKVFPKHPTRTYTARFPAHPLVVWLLRYLPIVPYTEATYPDDADPYLADAQALGWSPTPKRVMILGERTYSKLLEQVYFPRDTATNEVPRGLLHGGVASCL